MCSTADSMACSIAGSSRCAGKSPDAIRAGKRLLNSAGLVSLAEGLRLEETLQLSVIGKPNQLEAVQANMQKRPPRFSEPGNDGDLGP